MPYVIYVLYVIYDIYDMFSAMTNTTFMYHTTSELDATEE